MSENLDLKIRAEMRKRRMTFKELAALIGISGAYLSDILNGNRDGKKAQQHIETVKKYWTSDRGGRR
ncbi:helix-turn-helix domain-containing protein [Enterococcus faecium]|uniref:helix-turn-helix domain-containing protein n=2 Tax=Enterococcus faecium TaxID=1352 RepID=UPI000F0BAC78|nr:helix-turn-helix transcriptional regulator [Enterococcus faecium]